MSCVQAACTGTRRKNAGLQRGGLTVQVARDGALGERAQPLGAVGAIELHSSARHLAVALLERTRLSGGGPHLCSFLQHHPYQSDEATLTEASCSQVPGPVC